MRVLIIMNAGDDCRLKWSKQISRKRKHRIPSWQGEKPRQNRSIHACHQYGGNYIYKYICSHNGM